MLGSRATPSSSTIGDGPGFAWLVSVDDSVVLELSVMGSDGDDVKSMLELLLRENSCESLREPCLVNIGVGARGTISSWGFCGDVCVLLEIPGAL